MKDSRVPLNPETQQAADLHGSTGASGRARDDWQAIDWPKVETEVKRLQRRIAQAVQAKQRGKVKTLCRLLTRSHPARLLAVRRVTTNRGARTPGVDKVLWESSSAQWQAAHRLSRRGYHAQPLRRVYIPKRNGKRRPLGIPTMKDRAMQALHALALEPICECHADPNSYGFRPYRSTHDAIEQLVICLSRKCSGQWVLEGDIKACFDEIRHAWLLDNVPMDRALLRQWLEAGYVEKARLYPTRAGTPQGGIISPLLANWTLDKLEAEVKSLFPKRAKVHVVRYADDFVIVAEKPEVLEQTVKPALQRFLEQRGLKLSESKTLLTHIGKGFNFLGKTLRKFGDKLIVQPSQPAMESLQTKVRDLLRRMHNAPYEVLLIKLNRLLRGWANYHRLSSASRVFRKVDWWLRGALWRWIRRRHKGKHLSQHKAKYFAAGGWTYSTRVPWINGTYKLIELQRLTTLGIKRHIKIRGDANPYDPKQAEYLRLRREWGTSRWVRMREPKNA